MKPKLLLRIAAGCLLFFAAGHSMGHFTRHQVTDPATQEVLSMMIEHKFDMFGQMRSFDQNYTGMSLNLIFTLIAFSFILWRLSGLIVHDQKSARALLMPIAACIFGFCITSYLYFFMVPAVTCLIATVLILIAAFSGKSAK